MKPLEVVVGVVINSDGQVLVAKRRQHQHQADKWEFPGGKIEAGETPSCALARELLEEVGLCVIHHMPWLTIQHEYPERTVRLNVHRVTAFEGIARGCEGQNIAWLSPEKLLSLPLPKANEVIAQALLYLAV
ncbi:MAG: 8-oxo-dGTP diphosphatase MutT [Proteobacteria bacterium]|nr:8-oxo-dGTP diphosphatase MutT [Pseudomonadota bacterium]